MFGCDGTTLSNYFASDASIDVSAAGSSLNITGSNARGMSQTITLSGGETFAYSYHKVKKWNKDKTVIEDMEDDTRGPN